MGTDLAVIQQPEIVSAAAAFKPVMKLSDAVDRFNAIIEFAGQIMKEGKDYGAMPGTTSKCLLKPGAEKLCSFFGLTVKSDCFKIIEEWTGDEPLFYYWYKVSLYRGELLIAEGEGSCNSRESKYRYRWVSDDQVPDHLNKAKLSRRSGRMSEPFFAIDKAETSGKFGKPLSYWQAFTDAVKTGTATRIKKKLGQKEYDAWEIDSTVYRIPNPDICDQINTLQKMALKRALIAATLIACNASEYFTQDSDDLIVLPDESGASNPPMPPPPTVQKPAAAAPPPQAVSDLEQQFANAQKFEKLKMFNTMKQGFRNAFGEKDGEASYYDILNVCNAKHADEFKTLGDAKRAFRLMLDHIDAEAKRRKSEEHKTIAADPLPADGSPFQATDNDLPPELSDDWPEGRE